GIHQLDVEPLVQILLEGCGDKTLDTVGTVVRGDHHLVAKQAHLVFHDDVILAAGAQDADDVVACLSHRLGHMVQDGDARSSPYHDHSAKFVDLHRFAQGT